MMQSNFQKRCGALTLRPWPFGLAIIVVLLILVHPACSRAACTPPPPGLVLWWDFADGTATDRSGYQNDGTVNGSPTFAAGTVTFNNPFGFSPANQWISVPYSTSLQALATNSFTIAIRYKSTNSSQSNGRLFGNLSPNQRTAGIAIDYSAAVTSCAFSAIIFGNYFTNVIDIPTGSAYSCTTNTIPTTDGAYHWQVLCVDRVAGVATQYIDVSYFGSSPISSIGTIDFDGLCLGATGPRDYYAATQTTVNQLCVFNRALTSGEVAAIFGTGDLQMCNLFITSQPQSQAVLPEGNVGFTVSATTEALPLSYQWQEGNSIINGATNDTLLLTNLSLTNAGAFTVLVSDAAGNSVTSTPATLTIATAALSIATYPGITISGVAGLNCGIQYNTNLTNTSGWQGLTNLTLSSPTQIWYDSQPITQTQRFYRVVPGPIPIP